MTYPQRTPEELAIISTEPVKHAGEYTKDELVELLRQARRRLLTAGEMMLADGLIEEEEDYEENVWFCERINILRDESRTTAFARRWKRIFKKDA